MADRSLFADVCITHPAAPSRTSQQPLSAVGSAERRKAAKYAGLSELHGKEFFAFGMETYGAFGKSAIALLKLLRQATTGLSSLGMSLGHYVHAIQALAIGLQRLNATVSKAGSLQARLATQGLQ